MSSNSNSFRDRSSSRIREPKLLAAFVLFSIVFGATVRLLPHAWNVTPLTAIALFMSVYLGWRYSFLATLAILLASDAFLGFYQWQIMLAVYGSFLLAGFIGAAVSRRSVKTIAVSALASSLIFFLITNWAVWQFGTLYTHSFAGLLDSYAMAIPFFRNSLIGDLLYTGALFGVYEMVRFIVLNRTERRNAFHSGVSLKR